MRLVNESAKQFELKSNEVKRLLKEKQERLKSLEKSLTVYMVCLQLMNSRERSLEDRERRILELEREIGQLREEKRQLLSRCDSLEKELSDGSVVAEYNRKGMFDVVSTMNRT